MLKKNIFNLSHHNNRKKLFTIPVSTSGLAKPDRKEFLKNIKKINKKKPELIIKDFENKMKKFHNTQYCVSFCNGFWALVHSINALKIKDKSHALLPSMTYRRLADVCSWANLTPNFCDINDDDLAINIQDIKKKINRHSAIVLAVNPMTTELNYKKLKVINKKIPVLIDNVENANFYNDSISGNFTQIYSLHASKLLNGAEGGYVITNNFQIFSKLLKSRGDFKKNSSGFNLNPIHAVLALTNLNQLDLLIKHNKELFKEYDKELKNNKYFTLINHKTKNPNYKMILIKLKKNIKIHRDKIVKILNSENILARSYYNPPLHKKKMRYLYISKKLKITDKNKSNYIVLPSGYKTKKSDIKKIVNILDLIARNLNSL